MWISNVAILLGAEFNSELKRGRAVAAGHPIEQEPFSELRDDRKLRKKEQRTCCGADRSACHGRGGGANAGQLAAAAVSVALECRASRSSSVGTCQTGRACRHWQASARWRKPCLEGGIRVAAPNS
jgi:hypothetical protein